MNWFGLLIGIGTLLLIGSGFFWVIRGERYFGLLWWPYLILLGVTLIICSFFIQFNALSALLGVFGTSIIWGATELKEQNIRTELGWYPYRGDKIQPPFADLIKKWHAPHL